MSDFRPNDIKAIICGFHFHINNKFIYEFIREYQLKKYLIIEAYPKRSIDYDYNFFKYGDCFDYINWSEVPKLDENLVSSIGKEKLIAIEMLFRINHKMTYEDRKIFFYKQLRYWDYILKKEKINLFVSDNIPHDGFDYIIYIICKYRNIRTIMFHELPTRPHRHVSMYLTESIEKVGLNIYEKFCEYKKDNKKFSGRLSTRINNYYFDMQKNSNDLEQFTQKIKEETFFKQVLFFINNNFNELLKNISQQINYDKKYKVLKIKTTFSIIIKLLKKLFPFVNRVLLFLINKSKIYLSDYDFYLSLCSSNLDFEKKYVYLALHYQPELSTSPLAEEFSNQLLIIDILSKSLPEDTLIYVKEHPRISYNRNRKYYKKITSYSNIVLCNPELSTYDLIDNSVAVATATGSVGWESLLRKKPVLMFGFRFYQYAPNVFRIFNKEQCLQAVNKIISKSFIIEKEDILLYLEALDQFIFEGYNSRTKEKLTKITIDDNVGNYMQALKRCDLKMSTNKL